jgi:outer membrane protein assembly factor BamD (BamD/ComL family)
MSRLASLLLLLTCLLSGCATARSPISLTQWSWGRSISISKDKSAALDRSEPDDVTRLRRVDPDDAPKEPRRLFGLGGGRTREEQPSRPESRPRAESRTVTEGPSWWERSKPNGSTATHGDADEHRLQQEQFTQAEDLFKDGRLKEAEELLKPLSKKKRPFWSKLKVSSVDPGFHEEHNRVREDSLFLLAEAYYQQERFSHAQEYYEALLKDYPSTRHLNVATRRLFTIARTWLGFPGFATSSDVQPVNLEDPRPASATKKEKPPHSAVLVPNLTDKSRPAFDTPGHALAALKSIWMYDPRGPLADDAIMMTASHYLRVGNNQEADRYFSMLREEYPQSPHLQTSFILGSHVKLASYQGACYDVKQLEDARQLKESTLRLFPNLLERERLKEELAQIEEARAQRQWELVQLYRRKNKPKAMVIYAEDLLQTYPNSRHARDARQVLADLQPELLEKYPGSPVVTRPSRRRAKPAEDDDSTTARVRVSSEE